ncbi:unnamed protein product, partial [Gulo gulo]
RGTATRRTSGPARRRARCGDQNKPSVYCLGLLHRQDVNCAE